MKKKMFWMSKEEKKSTTKKTPFGGGTPVAWKSLNSLNEHTDTQFVFTCSFVERFSKIEIIGFAADCSLFEFEWSAMSEPCLCSKSLTTNSIGM